MNLILLIAVFGSLSAINDQRQGVSLLIELCNAFNANEQLKDDPRLKSTSLQQCMKGRTALDYSLDELLTINLKDIKILTCKNQNELCLSLSSNKVIEPINPEILGSEFIDDVLTAEIIFRRNDRYYNPVGIADKILELANTLKVAESETVNSIDEKERRKVVIPVISVSTDVKNAVAIFLIVLIWPYLYLFSIIKTIGSEIGYITERSGTDWVFFHNGSGSIVIGLIWLTSPIVVSALLYSNHSISLIEASFQITFFSLFSFLITKKIYETKKKLYLQFDYLSKQ